MSSSRCRCAARNPIHAAILPTKRGVGMVCIVVRILFFTSRGAIGIADGVGGWANQNIDPSGISNAMMKFGKQAALKGEKNPQKIIDIAYRETIREGSVKDGSTTVLVGTLQGTTFASANLGDSRLLIVSPDGTIRKFTQEQTHGPNFPFQIGLHKGRQLQDLPQHCECESYDMQHNDVIVLGTDGIFDNLFPEHVGKLVAQEERQLGSSLSVDSSVNDFKTRRSSLAKISQEILKASTAASRGSGKTPWSRSGGKPDDMTVVVAQAFPREVVDAFMAAQKK